MITEEQRQLRVKYIGSSDAPALMGVDPYRSAADIYLEKTGQADGFAGNEATDRGNWLEPVLLDWAASQLPAFNRGVMLVDGVLATNFDGISDVTIPEPFTVEAKTTNAMNPDEWGEPGTDQVPDRVIVQTHHGMRIAGPLYRVAFVPVLLPVYGKGFDRRMYRVERNDKLADAIADAGNYFWSNHVRLGIPPDDFRPSIEVLKRVRREPNKVVPVSPELVDALVVARASCRQAEEMKEQAERALLTALADAEGGDPGDGRTVTYMESKRKGYVVEDTTYRSLRVKNPKEKRS